jgi:ankyrin repeat protein
MYKNEINSGVEKYIEKKDEGGASALHHAASEGKESVVRSLLHAGANPLSKDGKGWTPLHYAAANGHIAVAILLIARNQFTVHARDDEGRTPLHRACFYGRKQSVQLLLDEKAKIDEEDDKGKTPLHSAVSSNSSNEDVIKLLYEKGADFNYKTIDYGWTILHSAARYSEPDKMDLLIKYGSKIEEKNDYGNTPLNLIIAETKMDISQRERMVNMLLRLKAEVNTQDNVGYTPLHKACMTGELSLVKILVSRGARLDIIDKESKTPLHYASKHGYKLIVDYLIKCKNDNPNAIMAKPVIENKDSNSNSPQDSELLRNTGFFTKESHTSKEPVSNLQVEVESLRRLVLEQASLMSAMLEKQEKLESELKNLSGKLENLQANINESQEERMSATYGNTR